MASGENREMNPAGPKPAVKYLIAIWLMVGWMGETTLTIILTPSTWPDLIKLSILVTAVAVGGFITFLLLMGIGASLGFLHKLRPRRWVRRLFGIPEDFEPLP